MDQKILRMLRGDLSRAWALIDQTGREAAADVTQAEAESTRAGLDSLEDLEAARPEFRAVLALGAALHLVDIAQGAFAEIGTQDPDPSKKAAAAADPVVEALLCAADTVENGKAPRAQDFAQYAADLDQVGTPASQAAAWLMRCLEKSDL